jgi:signal transduction histidine kinase
MDADQIRLQTEKTPLTPFLCGIVDFWQTMASEEDRCLTLNAPDSLPEAEFDPHRMRQVLGNLIDNAIRHTKPGGNIELAARADASGVTFRVSDDGEGIAPEDLPHVFDRFYRADPARRRSDTGSGLGLSISRRLVEMHGGTITVKSAPGQGTTFTITLSQRAPGTKEAPKEPRRRIHRSGKQLPSAS